jgi:hypothetical protein
VLPVAGDLEYSTFLEPSDDSTLLGAAFGKAGVPVAERGVGCLMSVDFPPDTDCESDCSTILSGAVAYRFFGSYNGSIATLSGLADSLMVA